MTPERASFPLSAAPRSRRLPRNSLHPLCQADRLKEPEDVPYSLYILYLADPRSGSSPRNKSLLLPSPPSSSPAQRQLPQKNPAPPLHRAAPRSGSSPRKSLLLPSIEQPCAAEAPPERASSYPLSSSPAQRQLPRKEPPPPLHRAAPRSGSSPRKSLLLLSIEQPRAAEAPPERASSLPALTGSPAQRKLPQKEPPLPLHRAALRSGSSPRKSLLLPSI